MCDFGTGLCACLEGYTGAACSVSSYAYTASNALPGMSLLASGLDYIGNVLETVSDKRVSETDGGGEREHRPVVAVAAAASGLCDTAVTVMIAASYTYPQKSDYNKSIMCFFAKKYCQMQGTAMAVVTVFIYPEVWFL